MWRQEATGVPAQGERRDKRRKVQRGNRLVFAAISRSDADEAAVL
jgi:hypothetical protein